MSSSFGIHAFAVFFGCSHLLQLIHLGLLFLALLNLVVLDALLQLFILHAGLHVKSVASLDGLGLSILLLFMLAFFCLHLFRQIVAHNQVLR